MGCCFSEPVDFDGEVNLFHFDLHRAVGKGAFGKVRPIAAQISEVLICNFRCGSSSISARKNCMLLNTLIRPVAFVKRPWAT